MSPAVIPGAAERGAPPDQVARWAGIVVSDAARHGPAFEKEWTTRTLENLRNHRPYAAIAVKYGTQAEKMLGPNATVEQQLRVLVPLATALRNDGKEAEADAMDKRVAELKKQIEK